MTEISRAAQVANLASEIVSVKDFGAVGDGATDDTAAIQAAIDSVSILGGLVNIPSGTFVAKGLVLKSKVILKGADIELSVLKHPSSAVGNIIESEGFDSLLSSGEADVEDGCTFNLGLKDLTLDGNRENVTGTPTATVGWGARLYGKRLVLDKVRINGVKGSGLYTALGSASDKLFEYRNESKPGYIKGVRIYGCEYDGWVYDGPSDIPISDIFIGWPANSLVDTVYDSTKRSLVFPSERPTNLVMQGAGAELTGFVHVFGNKHGWGYRIGDGSELFRLKASYLMAETTFGGVLINDNVRAQISLLDIHDNEGGDGSHACLRSVSTEPVSISNVEIRRGSLDKGSTMVELAGNRAKIGIASLLGQANAGHGVVNTGISNNIGILEVNGCSGAAYDTNDSTGYWLKSTASRASGDVFTTNCSIGSKYGTGASFSSLSITDRASLVPFDNFNLLSQTLRKKIELFDDTLGKRNTVSTLISSIDASLTTLQVFTVPHNLIWQPSKAEVQLSIFYTSGVLPDIVRIGVTAVNATDITVSVEFSGGLSGVVGIAVEV